MTAATITTFAGLLITPKRAMAGWPKESFDIADLSKSINELDKIDVRFENLKKIQTVFLNCYFNSPNTKNSFKSPLILVYR